METPKTRELYAQLKFLERLLEEKQEALKRLDYQIDQLEHQREDARRRNEEAAVRQNREMMQKYGARFEECRERLASTRQERDQLVGKCDQLESGVFDRREKWAAAWLDNLSKRQREQLQAYIA